MTYETKYYGTPYGEGGERGPGVDTIREAANLASDTLYDGQTMYLYRVTGFGFPDSNPVARWNASEGIVYRVSGTP